MAFECKITVSQTAMHLLFSVDASIQVLKRTLIMDLCNHDKILLIQIQKANYLFRGARVFGADSLEKSFWKILNTC